MIVGEASILINPNTAGFSSKLKAEAAATSAAMGKTFTESLTASFTSVGKTMQSVGKKATLAFTLPVVAGLGYASKAASDLAEQQSKNSVVFGKSAGSIRAFAADASKSFGMSERAALEATGTYGNLFTSLKIGEADSANMSKRMVGLSADLASFNNASPDEVFTALRAGLVGETEPLKKFGININEARLKQEALNMGLWDGKGNLDANAKAQASYSLILKDSTKAQGDFARTAESQANKQRTVKAQLEETAATLGEKFAPVVLKVLTVVSSLAEKFGGLSNRTQNIILIVAAAAAAFGPLSFVIGTLATVIGFLITPVGLVVLGIAALVAGVIYAYTHFEGFRNLVGTVAAFFVEQFGAIKDFVVSIWPQISEAVGHVLAVIQGYINAWLFVIRTYWNVFGDDIMRIVGGAFNAIKAYVEMVINVIAGIIRFVLAVINGDWGKAWQALKDIVQGVFNGIKGILGGLAGMITGFVGGIFDAAQKVGAAVLNGIGKGISGAVAVVKDIGKAVVNAIIDMVNTNIIGGINDGLEISWDPPGPIGKITLNPPDVPDIPKLHSGGTFNASGLSNEGLALLKSGETVRTVQQEAALAAPLRPVEINMTLAPVFNGDVNATQMTTALREIARNEVATALERTVRKVIAGSGSR